MHFSVGTAYANCDYEIQPAFEKAIPMLIQTHEQIRHRKYCVAPQPTGDGAGMPGLASAYETPMPQISTDAGHDRCRKLARHHDGALLDMQLQISGAAYRARPRHGGARASDSDRDRHPWKSAASASRMQRRGRAFRHRPPLAEARRSICGVGS